MSVEVTTHRLSNAVSLSGSPRFAPENVIALPVGLVLHRPEEVVDRLVAERGDADALSLPHERDRHAGALPGLPGPGRPLDEQVALPEREHRSHGIEVESDVRRASLEDGGQRRIGVSRVRVRTCETHQRVALDGVAERAPRGQGGRKRLVVPVDPAQHRDDPDVVVDPRAEPLSRHRVEPLARDLVLLGTEGHAVRVALALDQRRLPLPPQPAERGAVRDELVLVELRPAEPRPPLGSRLALVVLHEVAEEPRRVALIRA